MANARLTELKLSAIRRDGGTQARVGMDDAVVQEYAEALTNSAILPPAVVFFDGAAYWLADGWHRDAAYALIGAVTMPCEIHDGTLSDAKLYAYAANQSHGLRRSNADKRKAVEGMLRDFADWSDSRIARHVGVHHSTVAQHRSSLADSAGEAPATTRSYVTKSGTEAVMDISGQRQAAKARDDGPAASSPAESAGEPSVATPREQPTSGPVTAERPPALAGADDNDGEFDVPDDDGQHSADLLEELQAENTKLAELLKTAEADDQKAEALKWRRAFDNASRQQAEAMERAAQATKREGWTMAQLRRCGKAVGVDDPAKIAAAVEAAARSARAEA